MMFLATKLTERVRSGFKKKINERRKMEGVSPKNGF